MNEAELTGQISSGWPWVVAVYSVTFLALLGYGVAINVRLSALRRRNETSKEA